MQLHANAVDVHLFNVSEYFTEVIRTIFRRIEKVIIIF